MYDALIIGSGYGGSVMASRLAGKGKILLVERGRQWKPGEFNQSLLGTAGHYRTRKNPLGLWAFRIGKGVGVAFASGLGGASLVNYGITVRPEDHVFSSWPLSAREMDDDYQQVRQMLRPSFYPDSAHYEEQKFLQHVEPGKKVDLENTIHWEKCTDCGHCVPGCNEPGAKRGLEQTYLKEAFQKGLELLLESEVVSFEKNHRGYSIKIRRTAHPNKICTIHSRRIIFCTGTFGTLDLLHSGQKQFPLSPTFGQSMSMNGDGLAFLYNTAFPLSTHLGAPITTSVRLTLRDPEPKTLTVMSGRIPMSVMRFSAVAMGLLANIIGEGPSRIGKGDSRLRSWKRRLADLIWGPKDGGALAQTYMYKLDGQDGSKGKARFDYLGRAVMDWPDYTEDPIMVFAAKTLREWAKRIGGKVIPNIAKLPFMKSFGVHPLGGCKMAYSFDEGVVDSRGRIFDDQGGVYEGLYISDASILPTSVGVPPSMTVSALSERVAQGILAEGI